MLVIKTIKQTCSACPSQWEGVAETGEDIYIRFRYSYLRLDINRKTAYGIQVDDDDMNGYIDLNSALVYLKDYVQISSDTKFEEYDIDCI